MQWSTKTSSVNGDILELSESGLKLDIPTGTLILEIAKIVGSIRDEAFSADLYRTICLRFSTSPWQSMSASICNKARLPRLDLRRNGDGRSFDLPEHEVVRQADEVGHGRWLLCGLKGREGRSHSPSKPGYCLISGMSIRDQNRTKIPRISML